MQKGEPFWRIGIVDLLTLTAMVSVFLVFNPLLRSLIPDPDNGHDRRQYVLLAIILAATIWTFVLACSLLVRYVFYQKPNLFTIGNASLVASAACLIAATAKLGFEQIYFIGIERWSLSDPFFSQYWSEFPGLRGNAISLLLGLPPLCTGAIIATSTTLRVAQKCERSKTVFEWITLSVPLIWLSIWLFEMLVFWMPFRWLVQSGTHW